MPSLCAISPQSQKSLVWCLRWNSEKWSDRVKGYRNVWVTGRTNSMNELLGGSNNKMSMYICSVIFPKCVSVDYLCTLQRQLSNTGTKYSSCSALCSSTSAELWLHRWCCIMQHLLYVWLYLSSLSFSSFFPLFLTNSKNQNQLWLLFTEGKGQRKTFGTKDSGAKYLSDIKHVVLFEVKILESLYSHSWPPEETSCCSSIHFLHCLQQAKISTYSLKYLNI